MNQYQLIDSGNEKKLEKFGPYELIRPCPQAVWEPKFPKKWESHAGEFVREPKNHWKNSRFPSSWDICFETLTFKLIPTNFGHLGLFPEHQMHWDWIKDTVGEDKRQVLNLFAYSGGATLALAKEAIPVCHVDASKGMVDWARENAKLSRLEDQKIRWIIDDSLKFLKREAKRSVSYKGIILDPPSFGRGHQGQVFKIEKDLVSLLKLCREVVIEEGFIVLTAHTPGFTPTVLSNLLRQIFKRGAIEAGEMVISSSSFPLPSGSYARWNGRDQ
jgi:23S rRNA (cytosine1962-C5)-methyltransferase